jgi:hypothetical protein
MSKARLKQVLALGLLVSAVPIIVFLTGRLGRVVERAETGADPAAALTAVRVPVDPNEIEWLEDGPLPRQMEQSTRRAVGEAYLLSLGLLEGSLAVSDEDDLAVHLTGPALDAARQNTGRDPVTAARTHRIRVVFYSADGQIVELIDEAARLLVVDSADALIRTETAVALLVQIDGVWHLRHRVVGDAAVAETTAPVSLGYSTTQERKETP